MTPLVLAMSLLLMTGANVLQGATGAIGLAVANGSFQLDGARVWNNATLLEGSVVRTSIAPLDLHLSGGVALRLGAGSLATVYGQKIVLEQGLGQLKGDIDYEVEARSLRIRTGERDATARIQLAGDRKVTVAAVRGSARVRNAAGLLVANVEAGQSLDLEPQPQGAVASERVAGCILEKSNKFIVVEQTTNVMIEVRGAGLRQEVGNRVEISGVAASGPSAVAGASHVLEAAGMKRLAKGGCTAIAKKVGASAAAGAGAAAAAGAGASAGAATAAGAARAATAAGVTAGTVAVVGGVAAAATVGGMAVTGSLPGQSEPPPSASH